MPKIVDYADRVDGIREAVYRIVLRDGVPGITVPAVAAELYLSPRTIQRLVPSAEALPRLGLQWADRCTRRRLFEQRLLRGRRAPAPAPLDDILESLPGHADRADRSVWWTLVTAFPATDWAREAAAEQDAWLAGRCGRVVSAASHPASADEALRLHLLVTGAAHRILSGHLSYDDASDAIRRQASPPEPTAAVPPVVEPPVVELVETS